jgi:hypothetical protein
MAVIFTSDSRSYTKRQAVVKRCPELPRRCTKEYHFRGNHLHEGSSAICWSFAMYLLICCAGLFFSKFSLGVYHAAV